jgi:hypothetical protein
VSVTGVNSSEERTIKATLKALGGSFHENLTEDTTCLIVKKVGSAKYRAACNQLNIPVVVMKWLRDCKTSNQLMKYEKYNAPPLLGLTICCTQISPEDRHVLQCDVEAHGAEFSADLCENKCTHLIAMEAKGDKYNAAKMWGNVHIVNTKWVGDCVQRGRWIPEQPFLVLPNVGKGNVSRKPAAYTSSLPAGGAGRHRAEEQRGRNKDAIMACSAAETGPPPGLEWETLPSVDLVSEDKASIFGHDVFFISGFSPSQTDYLIKMILVGGGKRHFVLSMAVTKIFLGPDANDKLIVDACKHPCGAKCLKAEWLVNTLVPGFLDELRMRGEGEWEERQNSNSLDHFEQQMYANIEGEAKHSGFAISRSQRRRSLASSAAVASSSGLKRVASELGSGSTATSSKEKDSSYTTIRRRMSHNKNAMNESQLIDWNHE